MKSKGIVVKIKDTSCIVLLKDGTYRKVPLAGRNNVRVGAEIEVPSLSLSRFVKPALLVASIMIVALGLSLFKGAMAPETFAYISLDINPSMEFEVDREFRILNAIPVNRDAEELLAGIKFKGENLFSAINLILDKSAQAGYLKPGQKNYVLSTYTLNNNEAEQPESFAENLSSAIENKNVDIELVVMAANRSLRTEAKNLGLSTGKLAVYKTVDESGIRVSIEEVRDSSVTKLINTYKVNLLPNGKKFIVKSVHIPLKDDGDAKKKDVNKEKRNSSKNHKSDKEQSARDRQEDVIKAKFREQAEERGRNQAEERKKDRDKDNNKKWDKNSMEDRDRKSSEDKHRKQDNERDDKQDPKQDNEQNNKQNSEQNNKQDNRLDNRQDNDNKQDNKQNNKQNKKLDNKQDDQQEKKANRQIPDSANPRQTYKT